MALRQTSEIKELRIGSFNLSSTGGVNFFTESINGHIECIDYNQENVTGGALSLRQSGANIILFQGLGVNDINAYPFEYGVGPNGVTGSPLTPMKIPVNGPLNVIYVGGGSNSLINSLTVRYR